MTHETRNGLSQEQAAAILATEGPNELNTDQHRTFLTIFLEIVLEPMFLLLLGAGAIYLAMGDIHEAMILLGFVVIIMVVTILQERRTENVLIALRDLSSPRALVIRDGVKTRIAGCEVVPADILILAEGDRIPADGLVLEAHELAVDESMLTGESVAVAKFTTDSEVYAGTLVVGGQGLIYVTATGANTKLGHIGKSLHDISFESSPLREEISKFTKRLAIIGIGLCVALACLYWILRGNWLQGILSGITLAMGILPQEFPVIMIIFFALGARRIAFHKVLTRRLNAIETLGETTVLCVDKTGTLTQNQMSVSNLWIPSHEFEIKNIATQALPDIYHELVKYAVLASEISPHDPMEQAFHRFAQEHLPDAKHFHSEWSLAREYELTPELLAMSHLWRIDSEISDVVATKGAPEAIVKLCKLSEQELITVMHQAEIMASRGLRVIGFAKAKHPTSQAWPDIQHEFTFEFIGLIGLADPLRPGVPESIAECHRAGIRVVMITGDHPQTASAIATDAGINTTQILTGKDIIQLDAVTLANRINLINVFARVSPPQKLAIVEALKANGEVVAMTGDGVNDAPALKAAHIGIAMGKRGTDVAREAASLVLLEDDFGSIVSAIKLGRRIYANLRQAFVYTLAVHIPIIGLSIFPLVFGLPLILAPIHIAFLELLIDPACSVVFEAEPDNSKLMLQPPRSSKIPLISASHIVLSLFQGAIITLAVFSYYWWLTTNGVEIEIARNLAFISLVTANVFLILPCRSTQAGLSAMFLRLSDVGMWVIGLTVFALVSITCLPFLAQSFSFKQPSIQEGLLAFCIGVCTLFFLGMGKKLPTYFKK